MPRSPGGAFIAALAFAGALCGLTSDAAEQKRTHQLQLGLGFAAPFNMEEPFLDLAKTRSATWEFGVGKGQRLAAAKALEAGYLDPATYMPTKKSRETSYAAVAVFMPNADRYSSYYAGDYVLDWDGEAYGFMQRWPKSFERRRTDNSVEYSMPKAGAKGGALRFSGVGDGFTSFRLYRKENAARLARGELWNPDFINYVRRYDILRTMDLQSTNNTVIRRYDQIANLNEPWGQGGGATWPEAPFYSIPYEILFNLGVTADVKLWMTLPPQIGAPISPADPSLRQDNRPFRISGKKVGDHAAAHVKETLASPEWEKFATAFADRYVASKYPLTRPLYLEVGNEIWNNAGGFYVSTNYAAGIGRGINPKWGIGQGYGVLIGRYMMALETEFARRKIRPNIIYVVASHTANPWRTKAALEGLSAYLVQNGVDAARYLDMTGVAATNYYGHFNEMSKAMFGVSKPQLYAPLWIEEIKKDPDAFARRIETLLTDGPKTVKANGPWIVARWKEHKTLAERAGSHFIGGYEGGSHLTAPKELVRSKIFLDWWLAWLWSDAGADVGRRINQEIIDAFPGTIVSNYKSIGTLGPDAPWNDGHYSKPTPMMDMWDEFAKQVPAR